MSKYIDKDELWERLRKRMVHHVVTNTLFNTIKAVIDGMPTIEVSDDAISKHDLWRIVEDNAYWVTYNETSKEKGMTLTGINQALNECPPVIPKAKEVIYGNEHNCIMTLFGECSYSETGCGDCAVVEKVRDALATIQIETQNLNENSNEDAISREEVYRAIITCGEIDNDLNHLYEVIENFPSVIPKAKEGEWIYCEDDEGQDGYRCSECGFFVPWYYDYEDSNYILDYKACPHCLAKMKGADDE